MLAMPPLFSTQTPLLWLALGMTVSLLCGELFWRVLRLPRITGYTAGGMLVGAAGFGWVPDSQAPWLRGLIDLALAVLLFELGSRVHVQWFRHNRALLTSCIAECALTFLACAILAKAFGMALGQALLVGALAIGTSPAVVMRIAAETQARGQVTQRMLAHTAFNTVVSVLLVKLIAMLAPAAHQWLPAVTHAIYLLFGSLLAGALMAWCFARLRRFVDLNDEHGMALLFGLLLSFFALLQYLQLPALLPPLIAGIVARNIDPRPMLLPRHLGSAGGLLVVLLFILNGVSIEWSQLYAGGLAAVALIAVRALAKWIAIAACGPASGLSGEQGRALTLTLTPFSVTGVVLAAFLQQADGPLVEPVIAVVLSAVVISELACPLLVQWALRRSQETRE